MPISIDIEKACVKIPHLSMMKIFSKLQTEWIFIHLIKGVYKKPTGKHHVNSVTSGALSLKSGTSQRCHHHHFYCTVGIRKMNCMWIRKEETKIVPICRWHDYLHRKSMRICKLLEMRVQQSCWLQDQYIKSIMWPYTSNNQQKM